MTCDTEDDSGREVVKPPRSFDSGISETVVRRGRTRLLVREPSVGRTVLSKLRGTGHCIFGVTGDEFITAVAGFRCEDFRG